MKGIAFGSRVEAKYRVNRGGWDVSCPSYRYSGLWKGIMFVNARFEDNTKFCVGEGDRVFFVLDSWAGDCTFALSFPRLFACARDLYAKACDYMVRNGDNIHWGPIFRRDLSEVEEAEFFSLLEVLGQVSDVGGGSDRRVWVPSRDGAFTVASFFLILS